MMNILHNIARSKLIVGVAACVCPLIGQNSPLGDALGRARDYARRNMLLEAEDQARKAVAAQPESADAHYFLGYLLFRRAKPRESLAEYTEGAKYRQPEAGDLRIVGADYFLLKDYSDADRLFTRATEYDPSNVLGWYYLGRTKYNESRLEEAVQAFEKCLTLSPRNVRAEDNLGLSLQGLGRHQDALAAFQNAVAWQTDSPEKDPWPYLDLGSFLLEINRPSDAISPLLQATELAPDSPKAREQLGKAYLSVKDFAKAQRELEQAVRLEPDRAPAHYILGQLYQRLGQAGKAKQEFDRYAVLNAAKQKISPQDSRPE